MKIGAAVLVALLPLAAQADEGMWTYDNFPTAALKEKHGVTVDDAWLEHLRLSSVRLVEGCSGSFVSAAGLVLTNFHCAQTCLAQISTAQKDYQTEGFLADTLADEVACPGFEINQLLSIADVSARVEKAVAGRPASERAEAEKAEDLRIEAECASSADVRCDVVSLYGGARHHLYKYRRHQDVRLAFAPEMAIAFFGGDPDNFNFPRYNLDMALLRVWNGEHPLATEHYLRWSATGPKENELTFISGHPGSTRRQFTVAQLELQRDVQIPDSLLRQAEQRGLLTEYQRRGVEQQRHSMDILLTIENSYKANLGAHHALADPAFFAGLVAREKKLRRLVGAKPASQKAYGGAWDGITAALARLRGFRDEYHQIEAGRAFSSELFGIARLLVRAAAERPKPVAERLREFSESAIPGLEQSIANPAPIYDELEIALLTLSLTKLREVLGTDHPVVRKVLGAESPEDLALRAVKGTKLHDVAVRQALWEGGPKAIEASDDPMIVLARRVDPDARAVRRRLEDEYEGPLEVETQKLARARFAAYGASTYPDATFTLRLNYGTVRGWTEPGGQVIPPFTDLRGTFDRATGRAPYALPESWRMRKADLDLDTPFNFASDNDSVGGNSGSPIVNIQGELVGLAFDGNIHSLGGDFGFDETKNRAVSIHSAAILEAMDKVYRAYRLLKEIRPPR
jgi:hypothetical protein